MYVVCKNVSLTLREIGNDAGQGQETLAHMFALAKARKLRVK
jgi:hypothetical protein